MRFVWLAALAASLALPHAAAARLNRTYLVPVYAPCPGSGNCNTPALASSYTFDSIVLYSSPKRYTGPGKLALKVVVKGLRDANGSPATTTLTVKIAPGRVTILDGIVGTLGETSPFNSGTVYRIDVTNGSGSARYDTPDVTPERGLVAATFESPVVYDAEDKPLAATGTRTKP